MALTKAAIQSKFAAAKSLFSGSVVSVRHLDSGLSFEGVASTVERDYELELSGVAVGIVGAVRLSTADFGPQHPREGDKIEVRDYNGDLQTYRVITTRYSEASATMLLTYGNVDE